MDAEAVQRERKLALPESRVIRYARARDLSKGSIHTQAQTSVLDLALGLQRGGAGADGVPSQELDQRGEGGRESEGGFLPEDVLPGRQGGLSESSAGGVPMGNSEQLTGTSGRTTEQGSKSPSKSPSRGSSQRYGPFPTSEAKHVHRSEHEKNQKGHKDHKDRFVDASLRQVGQLLRLAKRS